MVENDSEVFDPLEAVLSREYQRGIEEGRRLERQYGGEDSTVERERAESEIRAHIAAITRQRKVLDHDDAVRLAAQGRTTTRKARAHPLLLDPCPKVTRRSQNVELKQMYNTRRCADMASAQNPCSESS